MSKDKKLKIDDEKNEPNHTLIEQLKLSDDSDEDDNEVEFIASHLKRE